MTREFTPKEIVQELDRYIIGQNRAKKTVAIALRNRFRRMHLPEDIRDEVTPKNILMIGPTGVGKTEIARRIAKLSGAPFIKVEVTKFTQVGYVGRDVDSIIRDLVDSSISMVSEEKELEVRAQAEKRAQERIMEYLLEAKTAREMETYLNSIGRGIAPEQPTSTVAKRTTTVSAHGAAVVPAVKRSESVERKISRKKRILEAFVNRELEERTIEIELEQDDSIASMLEYMTTIASDDSNEITHEIITPTFSGPRKRTRRVTIHEARRILAREESQKLIDSDQVIDDALRRVEENGIVFLDEIDKIVGSKVDVGPDVAGEGVQRDLLSIVEGSTVITRHGPVKTDYILWIAAGAFHKHKPSDLIPELQGRFPLRVELDTLTEDDFRRILTQPQNSLTRQYVELLKTEEVTLDFTDDSLAAMAHYANAMNEQVENIGARRLHTIIERILEDLLFAASEMGGQKFVINGAFVHEKLGNIASNEDMSKYIL